MDGRCGVCVCFQVEEDQYESMDQFREVPMPQTMPCPKLRVADLFALPDQDLILICDNCRAYNAPSTQYYKAADLWQSFFTKYFEAK